MSMPPYPWWLRGRDDIRRALSAPERPCRDSRLVRTMANGSPAFGLYRRTADHSQHAPFGLIVLEIGEAQITDATTYLDAGRLFPLFGLPATLCAMPPDGPEPELIAWRPLHG